MRIISGALKGRSINFLKNSNTRPLKDNVRESIFNILNHSRYIKVKVKNSNVLDLYSGTGSFGIECISRDAKKVTFIEKDLNASNLLKNNLNKLSISSSAKIYNSEIENVIIDFKKEHYHIFFFDPPFVDQNFLSIIGLIKKNKIFKKNHIVIIHREKKSNDKLEIFLNVFETKYYGRSKIIFGEFS